MQISLDEEEETLLFSLVYCSRASLDLNAADVALIASTAQHHNARQHITGWLVYSSGIFFQWLEGERANVKGLMAKIAADPRHNTIIFLSEAEEVRERLFSDWDMESVMPEDIRAVLDDAISTSHDPKNIAGLHQLLKELDTQGVALVT